MSEAMTYKLPPLPTFEEWCRIISPSEPGTQIASVENFVKAYAIAAIEAQASVVQQEPTTFLVVCPDCDGTGLDKKDNNYQCSHCHGSGRVEMDLYTHPAPQAKPQPLSREQVKGLCESAGYNIASPTQQEADFINGIRYAEAAHGITKE